MKKTSYLKKIGTVNVKVKSPFNFIATFWHPSNYESQLKKRIEDEFFQTIWLSKELYGLKIFSPKRELIRIEVYGKKSNKTALLAVKEEISFRFNLESDISNFILRFKADKFLKAPIARLGGMKPSCTYSLYEYLIVSTMLQNANVRRTIQMTEVLLESFGHPVDFAGIKLIAMWIPKEMQSVSEEELRELKIGYRAKNIKRITDIFVGGQVDEKALRMMSKENITDKLMGIYGVGPQTVAYILFGCFHRFDAFDHLSPWEGKIFSQIFFGKKDVSPEETLKFITKRYGAWRALAANYIFENIFWLREKKSIKWLEEEIRT